MEDGLTVEVPALQVISSALDATVGLVKIYECLVCTFERGNLTIGGCALPSKADH